MKVEQAIFQQEIAKNNSFIHLILQFTTTLNYKNNVVFLDTVSNVYGLPRNALLEPSSLSKGNGLITLECKLEQVS